LLFQLALLLVSLALKDLPAPQALPARKVNLVPLQWLPISLVQSAIMTPPLSPVRRPRGQPLFMVVVLPLNMLVAVMVVLAVTLALPSPRWLPLANPQRPIQAQPLM
jgi:hypothetical protein